MALRRLLLLGLAIILFPLALFAEPSPADPALREILPYRRTLRQAFLGTQFEQLETSAAEHRAAATLDADGSWRLMSFYDALRCPPAAPESTWERYASLHEAWLEAEPASLTARIAHAGFLLDYAWHGRGPGYANRLSPATQEKFRGRVAEAEKELIIARGLPGRCPEWWHASLRVAQAEGWPAEKFEELFAEGRAFAPRYWLLQVARARSLLPQWYGEPGAWERFAKAEAARPDGLGPEIYARLLLDLRSHYANLFQETAAEWPLARAGCAQLRARFPESLELLSLSTLLATQAGDRESARSGFEALHERVQPSVWGTPARFTQAQAWAAGP